MKLLSVKFKAGVLCELPRKEQVFLVQLTRLLNEINILTKSVIYATNGIENLEGVRKTAQRIVGLSFTRELAGKLYGGWEVLRKSYFGSTLSRQYECCLSHKGKDAARRIKKYFSQSDCRMKRIRHDHASHYDPSVISKELAELDSEEVLCMLVAEQGNCLYPFSEDLATRSILRLFDKDPQRAMDLMFDEVVMRVPSWFQEFAAEVLILFAENARLRSHEECVPDVPPLDMVELPFFVRRGPNQVRNASASRGATGT